MKLLVLFISFVFPAALIAMQSPVAEFDATTMTYRQATADDVDGVLDLLLHVSGEDAKRIVVYPEHKRRSKIEDAVLKGRVFIVIDTRTGAVVGMKKMFIVTEADERRDLLEEEIRCCAEGGTIQSCDSTGSCVLRYEGVKPIFEDACVSMAFNTLDRTLILYDGGDYTLEGYRGRGLNSQLAYCALAVISDSVKQHLADGSRFDSIAYVFGLVNENTTPDSIFGGRAKSLIHTLLTALATLKDEADGRPNERVSATLARFPSAMPVFDEAGNVDPAHMRPGYGYLLAVMLAHRGHASGII